MRRVLIAGCGYVGSAAADLFHQAGWKVEGWTRSAESAAQLSDKPYPVRARDISAEKEISATEAEFELVVQCASTRGGEAAQYGRVYRQGARNLIARFGNARHLFTSSTSVYAQRDGSSVNEDSPANPEHESGKILRETEQLVLASGGTVARFAGIYGPGRSALLQKFLRGEPAPDPEKDRIVNQIHRDDAAMALLVLGEQPPVLGQIYNVVDDQPVLQSEVFHWLDNFVGRTREASVAPPARRKRGESSKRVGNAKLRRLGWTPKYPTFAEGMEKSVLPTWHGTGSIRDRTG